MSLRANPPPGHALPPPSPISPSQSPEWSPLNNYNYGPSSSNGHLRNQNSIGRKDSIPNPADTPPLSVHSSANSSSAPDGPLSRSNGDPSPPSSIGRASIITTATYDDRKIAEMEQTLAGHYRALLRFLGNRIPDLRADPQQDRAKDKLQRLSRSQFQELSTDVYDELTRREEERRRGGPDQPGNPTPRYLLPKNNFHFKRNQARQKLSTLPTPRFTQLTTDVFFELERRFPRFVRTGGRIDSMPDRNTPSRGGMYPPRSVSRNEQDMRSVSREGFRKGPPPFGAPGVQPGLDDDQGPVSLGKPLPKMYQSNVILPSKGNMVEDDSEADSIKSPNITADPMTAQYKSQVEALEKKVDELVNEIQDKDRDIAAKYTAREDIEKERSRFEDLRTDLERKVQDAQSLNESLQAELTRVRAENVEMARNRGFAKDLQQELDAMRKQNQEMERSLRAELDAAMRDARENEDNLMRQLEQERNNPSRGYDDASEWRERADNFELQLSEQQKITDEVRAEASQFLQEMRVLTQRTTESVEKEEKLLDQIVGLEREVRVWKSRYAKSKSQARSLRSSSLGLPAPNGNAAELTRDAAFVASDGLVKDFHVMNFQVSIDDLLMQARTNDAQAITDSMRQVIVAIRAITMDMDAQEAADSSSPKKSKLRIRISQAANNLITATKSHSSSAGIAPVSLVDAAASHLTAAVVEVVRTLKIKQSTPEELEREDLTEQSFTNVRPAPLNTRGKGSVSSISASSAVMRNASVSSAGYSTYSRYSSRYSMNTSPPATNGDLASNYGVGATMGMLRENGVVEFKNYLEDTSAVLVRSIQPLVNAIRTNPSTSTSDPTISTYVEEISRTVAEMVSKSNAAVSDLNNKSLIKHAPPVIVVLENTVVDLTRRKDSGDAQGLPQLAFKIARATKELVLRVERIEMGEITEKTNLTLDI